MQVVHMGRETEAETLLALALQRPAAEREPFLAAACANDPDLRRELKDLLPYADGDLGFLRSLVLRPVMPDVLGFLDTPAEGRSATEASGLPEVIGGYRILRLLGYGSMGLIYEARRSESEPAVALKILYPWPATPDLVRRFASEAQVLARLQSPGITRIYEVGREEVTSPVGTVYQLPFLVLELVEGEPLDRYASRSGLAIEDRLRVFIKVCEAVHHAHQHGVIHRDLKPANILVTADGQPKILDFGISRLLAEEGEAPPRLTASGQILGSLAYMSPEQLSGVPQQADVRSDIYSLGVVLYEMLAGRPPFEVNHLPIAEAVLVIEKRRAPRLGTLNRALHGDLSAIVGKAMEREPRHRYPTADELADDVQHYLRGEPVLARPGLLWHRLRGLIH